MTGSPSPLPRWLAWLVIVLALGGCFTPAVHPVKKTESFLSGLFHPHASTAAAAGNEASRAANVSRELAGEASPAVTTSHEEKTMQSIVTALSSPVAPAFVLSSIHWLYIAALVCFLCAGLALWREHVLAAVKFAFAGAAGVVLGKTVSIVVGSFVLTFFAGLAIGVLVAWWAIANKAGHSGFDLENWINSKAHLAAPDMQKIRDALNSTTKG